jgi:hypothetical protein
VREGERECEWEERGGETVGLQRPQECMRWDADCILQSVIQRLLDRLQLALDLHFADADRAEAYAGDSLRCTCMSLHGGMEWEEEAWERRVS